ncbi:MAG: DUF1829 domain-containing protein [Candidatus Zixiibacteriota bacterium]
MIDEVKALMDQYTAWLRTKTALREVHGSIEVTTPYLDRHNDYMQFYVRRSNGGFLLTDDGFVIQDLRSSGCTLDSQKRQDLLRMTLNGFGVRLDGDSLTVNATSENFNYRKHNFLQAMLAVNDLFYLAVPMVASLFLEDVVSWLDVHEIRYTQNVKFTGKSGYDHQFHFVIPKSLRAPERIVQAITRPSRETAEALAFSWIDTRDVRPPNSRAFALLNDTDQPTSVTVVDALRNYDVTPIAWSKREEARDTLAA